MRGLVTTTPGGGFAGCAFRAGVLKLPEGLIPSSPKGFSAASLDSTGVMVLSGAAW